MSAPSIAASGTTEALLARARRSLPGGANSGARRFAGAEDLAIVAAGGATFTDAGGRTFVDYHAAYGPLILGHADPEILAAFTEAVRTVDLTGFGVTPYATTPSCSSATAGACSSAASSSSRPISSGTTSRMRIPTITSIGWWQRRSGRSWRNSTHAR